MTSEATGRVAAPRPIDTPMLVVVAVGGAIGAVSRALLTWTAPGSGAAVILLVNGVGCALMGALIVLAEGRGRLVRPFFGTGVLGGFTTVSTYAVTSLQMVSATPVIGAAYLLATPVLAVLAAGFGFALARAARSVDMTGTTR